MEATWRVRTSRPARESRIDPRCPGPQRIDRWRSKDDDTRRADGERGGIQTRAGGSDTGGRDETGDTVLSDRTLDLFAVTAPGLEEVTRRELEELGIAGEVESGGVGWTGDLASLYTASLHLRVASRLLVRVAEFRARTFHELERYARRVDWGRYAADGPVRLRVTSRKSKLYHEGAIAERFVREIEQSVGSPAVASTRPDAASEDATGQLFVIRFFRDRCLVSADASGALLHRRGYRTAVAKAPLRETLAAAILRSIDWTGATSILDPFCGSGTIPIEAALIARSIPPALANRERIPRPFAFQRWPGFEPALWDRIVDRAVGAIRDRVGVEIVGSDRDRGAIEAATANAERAGVSTDVSFQVQPLSSVETSSASGWIVTNPPYGVRIGNPAPLRDLYASLGRLLRTRLSGWDLAMLSGDPRLERQISIGLDEVLSTQNGGIPVRLVVGRGKGRKG